MRFLLSTGSLYTYGVDRAFELAARAGFDGVELLADRRWDTRQPEYVLRLSERHSLPVAVVHMPLEDAAIPGWPDGRVGLLHAAVALAEALGAGVVVHHLPLRARVGWLRLGGSAWPFVLPGRDPYAEWIVREYPAYCETTRVTLCIENLPRMRLFGFKVNPGRWNTPDQFVRFGALTLDTTHLGTWGLDPLVVYEQVRPHVRHIHLSNYNGREHRRPEDGVLRLDRLLARLAADGYAGAVTLELTPESAGAGEPDAAIVARLTASLAYCRAATRPRTDANESGLSL
jgi:sugar phosphate isomerase/epimerase